MIFLCNVWMFVFVSQLSYSDAVYLLDSWFRYRNITMMSVCLSLDPSQYCRDYHVCPFTPIVSSLVSTLVLSFSLYWDMERITRSESLAVRWAEVTGVVAIGGITIHRFTSKFKESSVIKSLDIDYIFLMMWAWWPKCFINSWWWLSVLGQISKSSYQAIFNSYQWLMIESHLRLIMLILLALLVWTGRLQ